MLAACQTAAHLAAQHPTRKWLLDEPAVYIAVVGQAEFRTPLQITDHLQCSMCHGFSKEAICMTNGAKQHTYI